MLNKKKIVQRHNPVLTAMSTCSPLSVGNGEFCFTADITGLQTLYDTYAASNFPLCTMSNWGWHTAPTKDGKQYQWEDLALTPYQHAGRTVYYPVKAMPGNEEVYNWLRHNPHKFNLGRISLCLASGVAITQAHITNPHQKLDLLTGTITSRFMLNGQPVEVSTACDTKSDTIAIKLKSRHKGLGIKLSFPYGHHSISGSDWGSPHKHTTLWDGHSACRIMDDVKYCVDINIQTTGAGHINKAAHTCEIFPDLCSDITVSFRFGTSPNCMAPCYETVIANANKTWGKYWDTVRLANFSKTKDPRAHELERRMVLSLYLLRIQAMGSLPPAETGLTLNSWYGRFHTEMYLWNSAFLPLWNLGDKLMPSLQWFYSIIPQAKALAKSNGYKGLRWPKQPANTGRDAPSHIAPLLVWQQPHLIYMLELLHQNTYKNHTFLKQHWALVKQLAEFMVSFLYPDTTGNYEMLAPIIPAQEVHNPREVKSPMFEMEYFRHGLSLACEWGSRLGHNTQKWRDIASNIAPPAIKDGLYLAHALCHDTYEKYNQDHPMMVGAYGLFKSPMIQPAIMKATLDKILQCWQHDTMWGWDYAMMAMCAINLGDSALAVELLLSDSPKNQYVTSGNNYQRTRADLPLYLPGNGSLLLALPMLFANPPKGWVIEVV